MMQDKKKYYIDIDNVILNTFDLMEEEMMIFCKKISREEYFQNHYDWLSLAKRAKSVNYSVEILREVERTVATPLAYCSHINLLKEMRDKIYFFRNILNLNSEMILIPYDILKSEVVKPKEDDVLVDDMLTNVYDFELRGSTGILFNQPDINYHNKVRSLEFLLKR